MNDDHRFLVATAGYTAFVGLVVGVLGQVTVYSPPLIAGLTYLSTDASDLAARLAVRVVDGALLLALALYLLVPLYALVGTHADDRRRSLVGSAIALLGLPVLWVLVGVVFLRLRPREVALTLGGVLVVVGFLALLSRVGGRLDDSIPAETAALGPLLAVLLFATLVVGGMAGTAVDDPLVEDVRTGPPQASFGFDYQSAGEGGAVLTVTHDGGDSIRADRLHVESAATAAVAGANQTETGPWRGSTTVEDGERVVATGDAVAVGVRDCEHVRVVWRTEAVATTVALYDCPGAR